MKVLIVQSEIETAETLTEIFSQRGDKVFSTTNVGDAIAILQIEEAELMIVDLHLPEAALFELLRGLQERHSEVEVIISNRYPDFTRELAVKEYGVYKFIRSPFSKIWVDQALESLVETDDKEEKNGRIIQSALPKVRFPVRLKIILPYLLLSLLLAMGAGYVVSRVALDTIEDRFVNNLIEVGQLTSAWLVEEENDRLETLRLLAFTDGLSEAIINRDAETLRDLVLGLAINNQEEAVEILDTQGVALVSLRLPRDGERESYEFSRGDDIFAEAAFVQKVLDQQVDELGDKYTGLIHAPWGTYFYIAGPITNEEKQLIGVVLVGRSISTMVVETREKLMGEESTIAHISLYEKTGQLLDTSHKELGALQITEESVSAIFLRQDQDSQLRPLDVAGIEYREILSPWEVREGQDIGLVGVSLAEHFLVRPSQQTQVQIYFIAIIGVLLTIAVGMLLARRITQPLNRVVTAASDVSQGKWDVSVEPQGSDELAVLAHTFNYMVSHLKEGEIYRDLLGRTVSPQVRDQLRKGLSSGNLKLEGQNTIASVMITDIRSFTVISERETPTTILGWLNQYFAELVPIINMYDGVTNEFIGDSVMAFFGVLPVALDPFESARQACMAAIGILQAVKAMNAKRREIGDPPMVTGIGINTGAVAAGGMGTADRLHYSVIGDTVNVTQRLESLTREIGETSAIISHDTYEALGDYREYFNFVPMGSHMFKGKTEPIMVYRLLPYSSEKTKPYLIDTNTAFKEDWIDTNTATEADLININTATEEDWIYTININPQDTEKILNYRKEFGDFSSLTEIKYIPGISPEIRQKIKEYFKNGNQEQSKRRLDEAI